MMSLLEGNEKLSTVASLGLVSPGAATQGVTAIFSWKTWRTFFLLQCHPYLFPPVKLTTFFARHCHFLLISLGCHTPRGCHPAHFLPVRPRLFTVLCKFSQKNIFLSGVIPLEGVTRGSPFLSPGFPRPSDATGYRKETALQRG